MLMRLRPRHPGALKLLTLLIAVLSALIPLAAYAGEPGGAPPASIAINLQLSGQFGDSAVAVTGSGVVNDNGEFQISLNVTQPSAHTLDLVGSGGVLYASPDGGAYQAIDLKGGQLASMFGGAALAGCANPAMMGAGVNGLQSLLGPGGMLNPGNLLQPAGTQVVDGVETEHLSAQIDLVQAAPVIGRIVGGIAAACGLPFSASDVQNLQTALAGGTLNIDAYLEQPGNFPRRVGVGLNLPAANVQFTLQADLTPNDTSSPILPPGQ